MAITWDEFKEEIKEEYNNTTFVVEQLDHELNVLLERRQAFMSKDVNPLVVRMDNILNALNPSSFGGDYFYKDDWYKNLDLESWGMYKYVSTNTQEGLDDNTLLVESLGINNEIKAGAELLVETDSGEKIPRTVESVEYSDYYEKYIVSLVERTTTWDRKWMPDALYSKCTDPGDEQACVAYNPCSDVFYKVPIWDDDLPESVESNIIPLKVIYGVGPYTWTIISGESDGWSLESETTDDGYNTLYSENTCSVPVIINVTDYCGNTTDEYTVINRLSETENFYLDAPTEIIRGETAIINTNNGTAPFKWVIDEMSYNENCDNNMCEYLPDIDDSINILYTNVKSCGYINIKVTDKCGKIAIASIKFLDSYTTKRVYWVGNYKPDQGSHLEYPDNYNCSGWNYRQVLIEIRSILNYHFSPSFLKNPLKEEISKKLWETYNIVPQNGALGKTLTFPEYGYLDGEEGEPSVKEFSAGEFTSTLRPLNYDWIEDGYRATLDYGKFLLFQNSPCCAIFGYRTYSTTIKPESMNCRDKNSGDSINMWWWENHLNCYNPKVRLTSSLMSRSQGRGWHAYGPNCRGVIYGTWPFYCSETFDPDYHGGGWMSDVGRWLGSFTLYVYVCYDYQGSLKLGEDGEYYLEDKWITV